VILASVRPCRSVSTNVSPNVLSTLIGAGVVVVVVMVVVVIVVVVVVTAEDALGVVVDVVLPMAFGEMTGHAPRAFFVALWRQFPVQS